MGAHTQDGPTALPDDPCLGLTVTERSLLVRLQHTPQRPIAPGVYTSLGLSLSRPPARRVSASRPC